MIDAIDRAILKNLQKEGRQSNVELSKKVGLSESACLRRVNNLKTIGIISSYVMILDQALAGKPGNVIVQVSLQNQQRETLDPFERAVKKVPEVMECYLMSGDQDYFIRVVVKDSDDYERIHTKHLTCLPGVARVKSNFCLRTVSKKTEIPLGG